MHSGCAGLSNLTFKACCSTNVPFLCPSSHLVSEAKEIESLRVQVNELSSQLNDLTSSVTVLTSQVSELSSKVSPTVPDDALPPQILPPVTQQRSRFSPPLQSSWVAKNQRKFNLLFCGVSELPHRTMYHDRLRLDLQAVYSSIESADQFLVEILIKDCVTVGKYDQQLNKPRPLLNSSRDVQSKHASLCLPNGSPLYIKKVLSKEERLLEKVVLQERRKLITSAVDLFSIKVRGTRLYVNSRLDGQAEATTFLQHPSLGDAAILHNLSSQNSPRQSPDPSIVPLESPIPPTNSASTIPAQTGQD
uniref:Uncharacterized protein n=1 Tax=Amphimedon queenslandica TaxID=400682 RepID=A0A1X7VIQ9_AMPQE